VICQGAVAKFGHRPDFQSIGQKGSKKILYERGKLRAGMKAPEQKEVLNQEPDWGSTKSAIQELFEREGHCALIGVACHPEFASKEHGWRRLKQLTKWGVNGTMSKLKELVAEGRLKLGLKARLEDARQSRECMEAYRQLALLGQDVTFERLDKWIKKAKTHRGVMSSEAGAMKFHLGLKANSTTAAVLKRLQTRAANSKLKKALFDACNKRWTQKKRKAARAKSYGAQA